MPSLLLGIFLLQLVLHIIKVVDISVFVDPLWFLYNKLPTETSDAARKTIKLKGEVIRLKKELNAVSAQDEFAKWAKLQRQYEKAMKQYDEQAAILNSAKPYLTSALTTLRWIGIMGLRFLVQWWFTKEPIFWLPAGWVPTYAEWILSFPRAPLGSISIQVWGAACTAVILLTSDAIIAAFKLAQGQQATEKVSLEPQAFPSNAEAAQDVRQKKEL